MKRFLTIAAAALLAATLFTGKAEGEVPTKLVLGMIPSREADVIVDSLEALAEMLEQALLIPVDTFISTNYTAMVEAVGTRRVDIVFFGPSGMVEAMDRYGAQAIVGSLRRGSTAYRAQFNVRCDSGITEFDQLRGKTIAWTDPTSASGYRFPFVSLRTTHGIDPDTEMTQIFAGSHDAAMLAVYLGDVDVALTFGGSPGSDGRTTIQTDYPDVFDTVCILGFSDFIPNDGAVVRQGLDPDLVEQITQALIDIADSEEGKVYTDAMFNVDGFARIDPSVYDIVRETDRTFQR